MLTRSHEIEEARNLAKRISEDLKKSHAGKVVQKVDIRVAYNIPYTKSVAVFSILQDHGFLVSNRDLLVPSDTSDLSSSASPQDSSA